MRTDYTIFKKQDSVMEITEHSNNFDIAVGEGNIDRCEPFWSEMNNLTLEELKDINQKLTNVISSFDNDYEGCKVDY